MSNSSIRVSAVVGAVVLAAAIGAAAIPASAAGTITLSELVPAAPAYAFEPVITSGKCDIADQPARITRSYPVEWPEVAQAQGVPDASTTVLIDLDSRGTLMKAAVADSSGNGLLDDEALLVVRRSVYQPEIEHCNRFARAYFINVMFD
ncbi:MAG TPA: TonB family protein [Candidatus Eremiobacteraceae bacterium]|nr:TonB family protein [Candidatus Eremiobacteraceae bacterium]